MKLVKLISAGALLLASSLAFAGFENTVPVQAGLNEDGSGFAFGDMLSARDAKSDNEFIGCGVRSFDDGQGNTFQSIFCQATGAEFDPVTGERIEDTEITVRCVSESPQLYDSLKMIDSYSFISFSFDETGTCTRVGVSTQSFYLPKSKKNKL